MIQQHILEYLRIFILDLGYMNVTFSGQLAPLIPWLRMSCRYSVMFLLFCSLLMANLWIWGLCPLLSHPRFQHIVCITFNSRRSHFATQLISNLACAVAASLITKLVRFVIIVNCKFHIWKLTTSSHGFTLQNVFINDSCQSFRVSSVSCGSNTPFLSSFTSSAFAYFRLDKWPYEEVVTYIHSVHESRIVLGVIYLRWVRRVGGWWVDQD